MTEEATGEAVEWLRARIGQQVQVSIGPGALPGRETFVAKPALMVSGPIEQAEPIEGGHLRFAVGGFDAVLRAEHLAATRVVSDERLVVEMGDHRLIVEFEAEGREAPA